MKGSSDGCHSLHRLARRRKNAYAMSAGMATARPKIVVTIACETPCASTIGFAPAETSEAIPPKAWNMPLNERTGVCAASECYSLLGDNGCGTKP